MLNSADVSAHVRATQMLSDGTSQEEGDIVGKEERRSRCSYGNFLDVYWKKNVVQGDNFK